MNSESTAAPLKVLVADDEPAMLSLISRYMKSLGFSVIEASEGDSAWELAQHHRPDLVILDVMMPGMSGWEICKRLKSQGSNGGAFSRTGVIMLTGIGENLNELTSPLFAADAWLNKPFDFADLDQRIRETLGRYDKDVPGVPSQSLRSEPEWEEPPEEGWTSPTSSAIPIRNDEIIDDDEDEELGEASAGARGGGLAEEILEEDILEEEPARTVPAPVEEFIAYVEETLEPIRPVRRTPAKKPAARKPAKRRTTKAPKAAAKKGGAAKKTAKAKRAAPKRAAARGTAAKRAAPKRAAAKRSASKKAAAKAAPKRPASKKAGAKGAKKRTAARRGKR